VIECTAAAIVSTVFRDNPYFPANSFFTASLTTFPSTRIPAAAKRAMTAFITVPMSFMAGAGVISAMAARTPFAISSSPAAFAS